MGKAIPRQHPAVVLRSQYTHLRMLLAAVLIVVVALTAAVVIMATDDDASSAGSPAGVSASQPGGVRYDGGPEEGSRGVLSATGTRFDGGPEEGTRGLGR